MDDLSTALDVTANSLSLTTRGWNLLRRIALPRLGTLRPSTGDSELRSTITAPDGTSWEFEARTSPEQVRNALAIGKEAFEMVGPEDFPAEDLDDEWQDRFWDDAKRKYSDDARSTYARILAGELRQPGSISKLSLSVLDNLDEETARIFQRYCTLAARFGPITALIHEPTTMDCMDNALAEFGITYVDIGRLAEYDLVRDTTSGMRSAGYFLRTTASGRIAEAYFTISSVAYALEAVSGKEYEALGVVMATSAGNEIARIVEPSKDVDVEAYTTKLFGELEKQGAKVVPIDFGRRS